jgi:nucleotide-binding universal stress UspA family protein
VRAAEPVVPGRRILVAAELDPDGIAGLRLVDRLGLTAQDELITVTVSSPPPAVPTGTSMLTGAPGPWLLDIHAIGEGEEASAEAAAAILEGLPCRVRSLLRDGPPGRAMAELAESLAPDLIVLPALPRRGWLERLLFGDPWGRLLEETSAPVVLARPDGDVGGPTPGADRQRPLSILVATQEPAGGADAIRQLLRLPLPPDARVLVLGCLPDDEPTAGPAARRRERTVRRLTAAVGMLRGAGLRAASLIVPGRGAEAITGVAASIDADLVMVGADRDPLRGRLGPVARTLARELPTAVLVVPAGVPRRAIRLPRVPGIRSAVPSGESRRTLDGSLGR